MAGARLYLITPPALVPAEFADRLAEALDAGDVACLQLRLKDVDDDAIRRASDVLRPIAQSRGVAFIMNDRPDLALETGSDGVHVGQEDAPYAEARRLLGPDRTIGVTCYGSRHLAIEAAEAGADYVAFGGFYASPTKGGRKFQSDPEILRWWSELMEVPSVAIGGITPANCVPLVQAGVDFLAVISAVWNHAQGPGAGVREFNQAIAAAQP
ncbi:MAG TPA: thiamine phosphate synthase [Stellaceae bacterium]|nr:thiamine phosphate synthase [Stellaceae bacterium]